MHAYLSNSGQQARALPLEWMNERKARLINEAQQSHCYIRHNNKKETRKALGNCWQLQKTKWSKVQTPSELLLLLLLRGAVGSYYWLAHSPPLMYVYFNPPPPLLFCATFPYKEDSKKKKKEEINWNMVLSIRKQQAEITWRLVNTI